MHQFKGGLCGMTVEIDIKCEFDKSFNKIPFDKNNLILICRGKSIRN